LDGFDADDDGFEWDFLWCDGFGFGDGELPEPPPFPPFPPPFPPLPPPFPPFPDPPFPDPPFPEPPFPDG